MSKHPYVIFSNSFAFFAVGFRLFSKNDVTKDVRLNESPVTLLYYDRKQIALCLKYASTERFARRTCRRRAVFTRNEPGKGAKTIRGDLSSIRPFRPGTAIT